MALRISMTVNEQYARFQALLRQVKGDLIGPTGTAGWYPRLQSGNIPWPEFVQILRLLNGVLSQMDTIAATPGIQQYVRDQEQDQTYDIAGEYTTMRASLIAIRDWIFNNLPTFTQAGTKYLIVSTLTNDGNIVEREFTPAQTAGLRTLIDQFRTVVQ